MLTGTCSQDTLQDSVLWYNFIAVIQVGLVKDSDNWLVVSARVLVVQKEVMIRKVVTVITYDGV